MSTASGTTVERRMSLRIRLSLVRVGLADAMTSPTWATSPLRTRIEECWSALAAIDENADPAHVEETCAAAEGLILAFPWFK